MGKMIKSYLQNGLSEIGSSFQFLAFSKRKMSKYKRVDMSDVVITRSFNDALMKDITSISKDCKFARTIILNEQTR